MSPRPFPSRNQGFVLVVVIALVMAMAGLILAFNRSARAGIQIADGLCKSAQAMSCAHAGLAVATAALRSAAAGQGQAAAPGRLSVGSWRLDLGQGSCQVDLADEQGRINLNRLIDLQGHIDRAHVDQFLRLIDLINRDTEGDPIEYGMVPALIDWIDADEQKTCLDFIERQNVGAESDYYQGLVPPGLCANRPLTSPAELWMVKGVTEDAFRRLSPYVTVYGDGLINLNAAPLRVIESLSEQIDPALAKSILDRRTARPFQSLEELQQIPGMTDPVYEKIRRLATVQSIGQYYEVRSIGQVDRVHRTVSAVVRRNTDGGMADIVEYREQGTQDSEVRSKKQGGPPWRITQDLNPKP